MPPTICKKAAQMESATASIRISARLKEATAKPLARKMLEQDNNKVLAHRHRLAHNRAAPRSRRRVVEHSSKVHRRLVGQDSNKAQAPPPKQDSSQGRVRSSRGSNCMPSMRSRSQPRRT